MVRIHNTETDEVIDREMNDQEFAVHEEKMAELDAQEAIKTARAAEKIALLDKLGISEDEARLLLG
jgi:hypothetical protein